MTWSLSLSGHADGQEANEKVNDAVDALCAALEEIGSTGYGSYSNNGCSPQVSKSISLSPKAHTEAEAGASSAGGTGIDAGAGADVDAAKDAPAS